jgi:serine/threonine protein phosphatase PrpC
MQGHRNHMEDRTVARSQLTEKLRHFSAYIVFDGHGGDESANHAQQNLVDFVLKKGAALFKKMEGFEYYDADEIEILLRNSFPEWDRELMHEKDIHTKLLNPNVRSTSGCTCTGVFVTPTHVILFNVGDSRTLIIDENDERDQVIFASKDHKPDDPEEEKRIVASGGFVTKPPRTYIPRVNGNLALSRAFGDFQLKMNGKIEQHEQAVIVDPDVTILERSEVTHIVVASDGVYDGLSNAEIATIATQNDKTESQRAYAMLRESLANESSDNMAAIVIDLRTSYHAADDDTDPAEPLDISSKTEL